MPAHRIARLIAVVAGIAGVVLCGLVPLLTVKQTTATIVWPQAHGAAAAATSSTSPDALISDITAPLVSGAPEALDVSIPCRTIATLPSYLKDDWFRDWGELQQFTPYYRDAQQARLDLGSATRSGLWSPAPLRH